MARSAKVAAAAVLSLVASGAAIAVAPQASASDWSRCLHGSTNRQTVFARAATVSGVPDKVLLGVSFMESRWDDHGTDPSTSGGFGPMHLTDRSAYADTSAAAKGERSSASPKPAGTMRQAADLTGISAGALRADDVANICGGAALLGSYQKQTTSKDPAAWSRAVARYSGADDEATALRFADQVFEVIRSGKARTTNDGQRVVLEATPKARVDKQQVDSLDLSEGTTQTGAVDCPAWLGCESVPAPYEWYGAPNPYAYGNHDVADRPHDMKINYIVIHDTEGSYDTAMDLVQDPTYLAWNYTVRSSDGHIAQHLNARDIGWHAGNWYVNMHSIGVEHEGFAAQGGTWFTESMYRSSASLVRYLAKEYGVPLDRAHIIGHDQVPGVDAAHVPGMHWDPGPYWNWGHYMSLLGAPIGSGSHGPHGRHGHAEGSGHGRHSRVVTVDPRFEDNPQTVTGCEDDGTCATQGSNFVYLHTAPSADAPLVKDPGLRPDGSDSTTDVADIGARATAGQKFVVAKRRGDWIGVWYLGDLAWMNTRDAKGHRVVTPSTGRLVLPAGSEVPVYGTAYPEASAYPSDIPAVKLAPLPYTLKRGQAYVLADDHVSTDYYYAKTFDDSLAGDHTLVAGHDRYFQIWFGHRIAYVRAADVR
jgi:hypothetical protein